MSVKRSLCEAALVCVLTLPALCGGAFAGEPEKTPDPKDKPWLQAFQPKRQWHISPAGTGTGREAGNPMSLAAAIKAAQPGDLFWLAEGTYKGDEKTHDLGLTTTGTRENPIVFRAAAGQRATVVGNLIILGPYTWVWGLEVTDPDAGEPKGGFSGSVSPNAPGDRVINCVIHNTWHNGIGAWNRGPDQVMYGNIVYRVGQNKDPKARAYPTYTQNNYAKDGYKFFVQNMFLDASEVGGPGYNFHGYTKTDFLTGYYLFQNFLRDGRFVIGGYNEPVHHTVVIENYFYNTHSVQFGYARPAQVEFERNYLARSPLLMRWFWGVNGANGKFTKPRPNVVTGNTIVLPGDPAVTLVTSGYNETGRAEKVLPLDPADTFDGNTYTKPFSASVSANGKEAAATDLAQWQKALEAAGGKFELNSKVVAPPTEPKIVLFPNDYEPGRAHLGIFNWSKAASVKVDLSSVLAAGADFKILPAKDSFGKPVVAGKYAGPVEVPLAGEKEFAVFLVTGSPAAKTSK